MKQVSQLKRPKKANAMAYSPETPIAVTKHFRSGGDEYLTPRQRAI
jgi:hypothetical protein